MFQHFRPACGFQRKIHAAVGDGLHRRHGIFIFAVNGVGGAQIPRQRQAGFINIHGDKGGGTAKFGGQQSAQAHRSGAPSGKAGSRRHFQHIHHRTCAGLNAAAQRPQIFKRRTGIHFHGIAFAADGIAGKRRLGKKVIVHGSMVMAAHGMAALLIGAAEIASEKFDTISRPARHTLLADAAMPVAEHHMVARLQSPHFGTHGFHNAGAFVPQHGRQGHGVILVAHNQIGVAHAGGHDFHQHFIPLRPADFKGRQHKICAFARGDGGGDVLKRCCLAHFFSPGFGICRPLSGGK